MVRTNGNKFFIAFLFLILSVMGIVLSIDQETGKLADDKILLFAVSILGLIVSLLYIGNKAISILLKGFSGLAKNVSENVFSGKSGIRGYTMNPLVKSFICPNPKCLKSILMSKINQITCPHCDTTTESKIGFFLRCPACHSKINSVECPFCGEDINLDAPYNHKELEEKRNG